MERTVLPLLENTEAPYVYKKSNFLKYTLFSDNLSNIDFGKRQMINTINPHSFCVAQTDVLFNESLLSSDILLPDGIGIVWAQRFLKNEKLARISGMDMFMFILKYADKQTDVKRKKIFFMGASVSTLEKIKARINREFPTLVVDFLSPPYKNSFTESENELMTERINSFSPHFLFVGMTAPKQEKWVHTNRRNLAPPVIASIGAVFDFYAGTVKRPSPTWERLGLEWLIRFINEPRRLWRRVLISAPKFVSTIVQLKFQSL